MLGHARTEVYTATSQPHSQVARSICHQTSEDMRQVACCMQQTLVGLRYHFLLDKKSSNACLKSMRVLETHAMEPQRICKVMSLLAKSGHRRQSPNLQATSFRRPIKSQSSRMNDSCSDVTTFLKSQLTRPSK